MPERAVAMTAELAGRATRHLLRADGQEDVCFALCRPSTGSRRSTAVLYELVLPEPGERVVHGDVEFTGDYVRRALDRAARDAAGLAVLHSHPLGRGWQGMSRPDRVGEMRHAAVVLARSRHPLVGMTLAGDGFWSARVWEQQPDYGFAPVDAAVVRVIGDRLTPMLHPDAEVQPQQTQVRTVAFGARRHRRSSRGSISSSSVSAAWDPSLLNSWHGRVSAT
jgi:hypothetical protein